MGASTLQHISISSPCAEHLRRQLESLLNKHEVDLVLSGHVHSYARTCNVLDGKCTDMAQGGCAPCTSGCHACWLSMLMEHLPDVWSFLMSNRRSQLLSKGG